MRPLRAPCTATVLRAAPSLHLAQPRAPRRLHFAPPPRTAARQTRNYPARRQLPAALHLPVCVCVCVCVCPLPARVRGAMGHLSRDWNAAAMLSKMKDWTGVQWRDLG